MDDRVEVALALGNGRGAVKLATAQLRAELDVTRAYVAEREAENERLRARVAELEAERGG